MAIADHLVPVFLGQKWLATIPLMEWLALGSAFAAMALILEMVLWVQGRTRLSAFQTWLQLAVLAPTVVLATDAYGSVGAAASRAAVAAVFLGVTMYLTTRVCAITLRQLGEVLWRPLVSGIVMALALTLMWPLLGTGAGSHVIGLITEIVLGAAVYTSCILALWLAAGQPEGVETLFLRQIAARFSRRPASRAL